MNICIYGAASDSIDEEYKIKAQLLGRLIAKNKHVLIFGGGNNGLMGSCARGASKENGKIIGIAPAFFDEVDGEIYKECTEFIRTETMNERKALLKNMSDAFVVLPGGIGTYDEFFDTLVSISLGVDKNKKVAIFNIKDYYNPLKDMLSDIVIKGFMHESKKELYQFFDKEEDIIKYLEGKKE